MSNKDADIFSTYYLAYILLKCCGLAAHEIVGHHKYRYIVKTTNCTAKWIIHFFGIAIATYTLVKDAADKILAEELVLMFYWSRGLLILGGYFSVVILDNYYNSKLISTLNEFNDIDKMIAKMNYEVQYNYMKIQTMAFLLIFLLYDLICFGMITVESLNILVVITLIVTLLTVTASFGKFVAITLILAYLLRGVKGLLTQHFLSRTDKVINDNNRIRNDANFVKEMSKIVQRLVVNQRILNKCFSMQNLLSIAENCCTIIACILSITSCFTLQYNNVATLSFTIFGNSFKIGSYAFVSTLCRREVSLKITFHLS